MTAHDRYDALAGAMMLGEATPAERAEFDAHVASCAACRLDVGAGLETVAAIARSRDEETWRPSVSVMATIRERSQRRFRWTLGAFGWAVGVSLVLNVALVGGAGNGLITRLSAPAGESNGNVASSTITFDAPHSRQADDAVARTAVVARAADAARRPSKAAVVARTTPPRPVKRSVAAPLPAPTDDVPDLLAGLDLDGNLDRHAVALERTQCRSVAATETVAAQSEAAPADAVRPCASPHP